MAVVALTLVAPRTALAVSFGDVITSDTTLTEDLAGNGTGLIIGADGVTLDLGGYTLSSLDGLGLGVDNTGGYDNITIKNGVIQGFMGALLARDADGLRVEDITVDGLSGEGTVPGYMSVVGAIQVFDSSSVLIQNCSLLGIPKMVDGAPGPDGIYLSSVSGVKVKNVQIQGGYVGVVFWSCGETWSGGVCPPFAEQPPTNGTVEDSAISGNRFGIYVVNTTDARVQGNVITGASTAAVRIGRAEHDVQGVTIQDNELYGNGYGIWGERTPNMLSGVTVKNNTIYGNTGGIFFRRTVDSAVMDNSATDNRSFGLLLNIAHNNVVMGNDLSYNGVRGLPMVNGSNGNVVKENTLTGNGIDGISLFLGTNVGNVFMNNIASDNGNYDMLHNSASSPNTWKFNTCGTSSGADIDCP